MAALGLLFVGSVLFVNGLSLLGLVDPRAAAPINLFVGALLVVVVLSLALSAGDDLAPVFTAAGFLLFGFVYLYVGIVSLTGHAVSGVGWYCAWAAVVSLVIAVVTFTRADVKFGLLWLLWALLFTMFFVVLGLGLTRFTVVTGWITVTEAIITATIPGLLLILGVWEDIPDVLAGVVTVMALVLFAVIGGRTARRVPAS